MRLVDADALKEKAFLTYQNNGAEIEEIMVVPIGAIDNAPTVEAYTFEQVQDLVALNKKLSEERPQGKWIINEDGNYECSECGIAWKDMPTKDAKPVFKAYPWCGVDMRGNKK